MAWQELGTIALEGINPTVGLMDSQLELKVSFGQWVSNERNSFWEQREVLDLGNQIPPLGLEPQTPKNDNFDSTTKLFPSTPLHLQFLSS